MVSTFKSVDFYCRYWCNFCCTHNIINVNFWDTIYNTHTQYLNEFYNVQGNMAFLL